MDRRELETTVRDWLGRATVDPRTGLPPLARLRVEASYLSTIGHLEPGQDRPDSGMELWMVTATMYFPESSDMWEQPGDVALEIVQVLGRIEHAVNADPSLGRRGVRARYSGTDSNEPHQRPSSPPDYPWAVDVVLSVHIGP